MNRGGAVRALPFVPGKRPPLSAAVDVLVDEIVERVSARVVEELGDRLGDDRPADSALVDRKKLARRLTISESALDRLRREEKAFPCVFITPEAPRFCVDDVVAFLKARGAR